MLLLLPLLYLALFQFGHAQNAKPLQLGVPVTINVGKRNWTYFSFNVPDNTNSQTFRFTVKRNQNPGQDIVYIRRGALPTKIEYDEIDTEATGAHAIQFIPQQGVYYFAILNLFVQERGFEVLLVSLAGKQPTLAWEGNPIPVCEGNLPPMYGPPSIAIGLSSFAVACAKRNLRSRATVEFRKLNGELIRYDTLRTPRGNFFAEPAVKFISNTYQVVNTYEVPAYYNYLNLRSYEQDGTLIQNRTTWGNTYLPESREFFPNIIWNGNMTLVYWHQQWEWYAPFMGGFDLRGQSMKKVASLSEPRRNPDGQGAHAARLRAVMNPYVSEDYDFEVGVFVYEARPGSPELSFCIQRDLGSCRAISFPGDSWINATHGGLDATATERNQYVLVHPVTYETIQVTLIGSDARYLNSIRIKHDSGQPNLLTIDEWVFLTTEFNGVGFITVLNNNLDIILTEPIGSQSGRKMKSPVLTYQPLLDMLMVMYTDPDTQQAMVQRLTLTLPE